MKRFKRCLLRAVLGVLCTCVGGAALSGSLAEPADGRAGADYAQSLFDTGVVHEIHVRLSVLPYVEKDPTAFCSAAEYKKGCETLKQFGMRRAESVRRQLNGDLATVSGEQSDRDKVDASDLRLLDMDTGFSKNP